MNKEAEINKELIKVLEEKIQLLEEQKVISQKIIDIQKEQLTLTDVVKSLPQDNYCQICNLPTDGEKCFSKRCPI